MLNFSSGGAPVLIACWSVKGGVGTTVVAASLAVLLARAAPQGVLLVDLGGDAAVMFGREDEGRGIEDWLGAQPGVGAEELHALEVAVGGGINLLGRGVEPDERGSARELAGGCAVPDHGRLASVLGSDPRPVIVDLGTQLHWADMHEVLHRAATKSLLVLRPCYLAVRRAVALSLRPNALVIIDEPGRSLRVDDIEEVLGVPAAARLLVDPAVARTVDSGLLGVRLPRSLERGLRHVA